MVRHMNVDLVKKKFINRPTKKKTEGLAVEQRESMHKCLSISPLKFNPDLPGRFALLNRY